MVSINGYCHYYRVGDWYTQVEPLSEQSDVVALEANDSARL
jgi:hypothetical protein